MTGYNTQATPSEYRIQLYTNSAAVYTMVQDYIRRCMDWECGRDYSGCVQSLGDSNDVLRNT